MVKTNNVITIVLVGFILLVLFITVIKARKVYPKSPELEWLKKRLEPLDPIVKTLIFTESDASYSEDKEVVFLCIKDNDTGKFLDLNTITYVAIHEIAHCISDAVGHKNDEFKGNFSKLLKKARSMGILDNKPLTDYCSMCVCNKYPTD